MLMGYNMTSNTVPHVFLRIFFILMMVHLFHFDVYSNNKVQEVHSVVCRNALTNQSLTQLSVNPFILKLPHNNSNFLIRFLKQRFGSLFLEDIPLDIDISDLAENIYRKTKKYGLTFITIRDSFLDNFNFLETHPHVIKVKANETKTFYIHVVKRNTYIIYLANKTSYGEVLSYIKPMQTGNVINWFKKQNMNEIDWSSHVDLNEQSAIFHGIFEEVLKEYPLHTVKLNELNLIRHSNSQLKPVMDLFKEIHKYFGKYRLDISVLVTSFQNRLQATKPMDVLNIVQTLSKVLETKFHQRKKYKKISSAYSITLLSLLIGLTLEDTLALSKEFEFFEDSQKGAFLYKALLTLAIRKEIEDLKTSYIHHIMDYKDRFDEISIFLTQINSNYEEARKKGLLKQFENMFLLSMIRLGVNNKITEEELTYQMRDDMRFIFKNIHLDKKSLSQYMPILLLMASTRHHPIETLVDQFNKINNLTKDPKITLILLRGVQAGYSSHDMIHLYQSGFSFFRDENISHKDMILLITSGWVAGLKPEQVMLIFKEATIHSPNVSPDILVHFVDSIINLHSMPYRKISKDGVIYTVSTDSRDQHTLSQNEIHNHLISQLIYWMTFTSMN